MTFERGCQGFAGIVDREPEIVVLGMLFYVFEHFDRDGGVGPGGGDNGFEADLWMLVVGQAQEVLVGVGKIAPATAPAARSGTSRTRPSGPPSRNG